MAKTRPSRRSNDSRKRKADANNMNEEEERAEGTAGGAAEAVAASLGESDPANLRVTQVNPSFRARLVSLVYNYRTLGHTEAWIDPLSLGPPDNPCLDYQEFGFTEADLEEEVATQFFAGR